MIALSVVLLMVVMGLVLDFGLVRVDRQVDKAAADAASLAGGHGLITSGDGTAHPFVGVCSAVRYLQQSSDQFGGLSDTTGSWTTGTGGATANGCTDAALQDQSCTPGSPSSWAVFSWTGSVDGKDVTVRIQSGYDQLGATSGWAEDTLPAAAAYQGATSYQGCDQLAVVIKQSREPGFGSLATSSSLNTDLRSVARVKPGPAGYAPAMLLLKQTGCPTLALTASGGGASSYVHVFGARNSSNGLSQPGTIHSDSDATGCSSSIFDGKAADGIVTYAAPLASGAADVSKPGSITSVAGAKGVAIGTVRDSASNVYGSASVDAAGAAAAGMSEPTGRLKITRVVVDKRYRAAVGTIMGNAQTDVFSSTTGVTAAIAV